jgi:hypothetical protein
MKKTLAELMLEEEGNDKKLRTKKPAELQPLEFNRYQF